MENAVSDFKDDLAVDVHRSQNCDLDSLLKYKLSSILKQDSQEKQKLDDYQKYIERLERELDTLVQTKAAEWMKENEQDAMNRVGLAEALQSNPEIATLRDRLQEPILNRQKILDDLFDECLKMVLPFCEDKDLQHYLAKYEKVEHETDFYLPFVNLCNYALDCMNNLPSSDIFKHTSSLNCRFHRNDPMSIIPNYQGLGASIKPDVIVTSTIAVEDSDAIDDPSAIPEFGKAPKYFFEWRQILCCSEFKRSGSRHTPQSQKPPYGPYDKGRQSTYECGAKGSVFSPGLEVEAREPPAKRIKLNMSEPTGAGTSKTRHGPAKKTKIPRGQSHRGSGSSIHYPPSKSKSAVDAHTQCAMYGMEMLSYTVGVHHAITLLIIDSKLWVWYYDRQGVIQSNGINFVQDLPRFLILLFAFQRFDLVDWGIIVELNPGAVLAHKRDPDSTGPSKKKRKTRAVEDARLERKKNPQTCILEIESLDSVLGLACNDLKRIDLYLDDWLSHQPHCLAGRATATVGASDHDNAGRGNLACKISFPEVARCSEGETIDQIRKEIEKNPEKKHFSDHLPDVLVYGDMSRYGTQRVRSMLQISIKGYRTLRVLVSRKLAPLTTLDGVDFVRAWLEVVRFHAFLWSCGVEHGDPSLWNVMYNEELKCGVLGDYDLSIIQQRSRMPGSDRTGTIPFMAVDLLTDEYWDGKVERLYRHELEAFIWILPFVCLRYQGGMSQKETPVDPWMTSNHHACLKEKTLFWTPKMVGKWKEFCQPGFQDVWELTYHLLLWWRGSLDGLEFAARHQAEMDMAPEGLGGRWWNMLNIATRLWGKETGQVSESNYTVSSLWPVFIAQLQHIAKRYPNIHFIDRLISDLDLATPFWPPSA